MGVNAAEFECIEKQFVEIIGEFQSLVNSENRLREAIRSEAARAEAAEVAREAAERAAVEARSSAAAATEGATQATAALARAHEEVTNYKIKFELSERQRILLEERCTMMSGQLSGLEKELQQLRPLQSSHNTLQRQYLELQERIRLATEEARNEASRLESEVRRVERCAGGGSEIRERARLAAAAHARDRRLTAAELHHTNKELLAANTEISRLGALVAELQHRLAERDKTSTRNVDTDTESLAEVKAALEAERAGTARLERALTAALADNATLAAQLHANDNPVLSQASSHCSANVANMCPIDSFLAD